MGLPCKNFYIHFLNSNFTFLFCVTGVLHNLFDTLCLFIKYSIGLKIFYWQIYFIFLFWECLVLTWLCSSDGLAKRLLQYLQMISFFFMSLSLPLVENLDVSIYSPVRISSTSLLPFFFFLMILHYLLVYLSFRGDYIW